MYQSSGIILGGDFIANNKPWNGQWTILGKAHKRQYDVNIAEASAVILRIPLQ
ncbi:MAG: hypothetical protein ACTHM7_02675 [Ginsengibacter sp.]